MGKIIKKIVYSVGWILFLLMVLGILSTILINSSGVQRTITTKAFDKLEMLFGNRFEFSNVRLALVNRIEIKDLLITDLAEDTIIYAPEFSAHFPGLIRTILKKDPHLPINIRRMKFNNAYFRLYNDSTNTSNIKFLFDTLSARKDTAKPPGKLEFRNIDIKNSRFLLMKYDTAKVLTRIEYSQMEFNDLNIRVKDFSILADTLMMHLRRLSFEEKSGFKIRSFSSKLELCKNYMHFDGVKTKLLQSNLKLEKAHFDFNLFKDFANGDFFEKVKMQINITESSINMLDVGYFAKIFEDMDHSFSLSGDFYGNLANFNGRKLKLKSGSSTHLEGRFDVAGLPDVPSTFLYFDIKDFTTTAGDMNALNLPKGKKINLPKALENIENFQYQGNFTGFFRDFVSYGQITTNHGVINTDLLFAPDSNNLLSFSGHVISSNFDVGILSQSSDKIGKITLDMEIDGQGLVKGGFDVDIKGEIKQFEVNNYNYTNIDVDGIFSENKFNGKLEINDPNAKLEFDGLVDLSSEIRQYVFTANVFHANLYNLNFSKNDPNYTGSFLLNAELYGNTLDEINGEVKLLNSLFTKTDGQIQVYDIQLNIVNDSVQSRLALNSDFLDGEVRGVFKPTQLLDDYLKLANNYLTIVDFKFPKDAETLPCDYNFNMEFKNSRPVFMFFLPNYSVSPQTKIAGWFKRDSIAQTKIHVFSPEMHLKKTVLKNLAVNASTHQDKLRIELGSEGADLGSRVMFDNFTLLAAVDSNKVNFQTRWMNWDSLLQKGNISGELNVLKTIDSSLSVHVAIDSSDLVLNDSEWSFNSFNLYLDSSTVFIDDFQMFSGPESIFVNGYLRDGTSDSLYCRFEQFDFSNLNNFTRSEAFRFGGTLEGDVVIKGFARPLIFSEMKIDSLALNNEPIGDTYFKSRWDNARKALVLKGDVYRGQLNTLNILGDIYPVRGGEMDINLDFKKFRLNFVKPYLDNIFDDVLGLATGSLHLSGTTAKPKLNGSINLQKTFFTVDYLKTRYNFTAPISFSNNNIVFDNVEMKDKYGNSAMLNGLIKTEYFKEFALSLSINANRFLLLDTKEYDNDAFFGKAFATGLIRMNGKAESLKFEATVKTEPGTDFNIPVTDSEELVDYTFIKYLDKDTLNETVVNNDYKVNLSGMQMDFNVTVTPDAKVKIIFDPAMGDIIETKGSGQMRLAMNAAGDFSIVGDYIIEQGDYLFTIRDFLVSKSFKVKQGSSLRWSGDPINADVDINTYFRTKASMKGLLGTADDTYGSKTVDCMFNLRGKLMEPEVKYDIELPFAEQAVRDVVASRISTEEERGKQFLSLLILSEFLYTGGSENTNSAGQNVAGANTQELLSNQLSNWLSQISNDFDVDVNYRGGGEDAEKQLGIALSADLLNDKLNINGSVEARTNAELENTSEIVGDVDIDYKITKSGNIRARVYNRASEQHESLEENSLYTQGIGVFYAEEFDSLGELAQKYRNAIAKRKEKRKNKKNNQENKKRTPSNENAIKDEEDALF